MNGFFFFPKIVKKAMKGLTEAAGSEQAPIEGDGGIVSYNDHNMLVCEILKLLAVSQNQTKQAN